MSSIPEHKVAETSSPQTNEELKRASGDLPLLNKKENGSYEKVSSSQKHQNKKSYIESVEKPLVSKQQGKDEWDMGPFETYQELSDLGKEEHRQKWLNVANLIQLLRRHKTEDEKEINLRKVPFPIQSSAYIRPVSNEEFKQLKTVNNWKRTRLVSKMNEHVKVVYYGDENKVEIIATKM